MSDSQSPDWLIEQRVAQLEEISQRRNVLLKQMHQMLRRKHDIGTLIPALDEADSHELNEFLERFDLEKCPEGITSLSPDKLAIPMPSSFLDDLEDVDQDSDDILALRPTEDAEVGNRHHGHKAKPPQSRFRLRPADQDDSDRDELDFLSSTTPRSPSHHSPTPVKSRSTSQVSPNPTSNVIDISVSRPPSPAPIVVDGDSEAEEGLPEDIPVVEDTAVSQANLDITGRDSSSHPSPLPEALPSHQIESRPPSEPDSAPSIRDGMDVDDADGPSSPSNLVEDVTMEFTTKSEASQEPNALHPLGTPPQDDQSVPAAVASAIEGPLTPVEDVLSEVEPRPQDEGDTKSPGPGGQTASHPDNAKEERERSEAMSRPDVVTKSPHVSPMDGSLTQVLAPPTERPSAEDVLMKEQSRVAQPLHNKQNAIVDLIPTNTEERLLPHQPPTVNPTLLFPPPAEVPRRLPPTFLSRPKSPGPDAVDYVFESKDRGDVEMSAPETSPTEPVDGPQYDPHYTLPPLKSLPIEYQRKGKLTKRKKERERKEKEKDGTLTKEGSNKEEGWAPMGMSKWAAVLNANPVHTKVSKASKCLLTRDWGIAFMELRLVKTFKRIEHLKDAGQWSFRQPKKQRGVGGLTKSHWDYLMDEMKWMRTDFREERRWKLAVAFNLSTAVLEWHAAGTNENRVALGICVKWTPPPPSEPPIEDVDAAMDIIDVDADHSEPLVLLDDKPATPKQDTQPEKPINALSILNYNSDDDDDEDQERSQDRERSISDGLDTAAALDDHFEAAAQIAAVDDMIEARSAAALQPKTEETDDTSALQSNANAMEVDVPTKVEQEPDNSQQVPQNDSSLQTALKTDSTNPLLMSTTTSRSSDEPSIPANGGVSKSALKQLFAPVREEIAYSDIDQLFLNFEDLDISQRIPKEPSAADVAALFESLPTPNDLTTVFPDLHPYGMFDLAPPTGAMVNGDRKKPERKSDRDDPNKRAEDFTYSKLVPIGKYAHCKPTLLGPLQPSKKWKDGEWLRLDEYVVVAEEHPPSKPLDIFSDVFENNKPLIINPIQLPKDFRRTSEVTWTPAEDALLKSLIECYPYNWALISECFNSARSVLATDKRTPRDCIERCDALWGGASNQNVPAEDPSAMTPTTQMTTRKRLASISTPASTIPSNGSEPKKRRRHLLVHEAMRKQAKLRLLTAQKNATLAQRKASAAIHETHLQLSKMPKLSPAELGRMKADKETRESDAKRKQDEFRLQQYRMLQAATNGQSPAQIAQVGIAQHQRISTPSNSRLSPQQVAQAQAHLQRNLLAQQAAQAQAQQGSPPNQAQAPPVQGPAQVPTNPPAINGASPTGQLAPPNPIPAVTANAHATYGSPPRSTGTPVSAAAAAAVVAAPATSPRPTSAQAQAALIHAAQVQRQTAALGYYMAPNGQPYTPEQINAMRQLMHQQAVAAQAQAAQAQAQQQQQQSSSAQG